MIPQPYARVIFALMRLLTSLCQEVAYATRRESSTLNLGFRVLGRA